MLLAKLSKFQGQKAQNYSRSNRLFVFSLCFLVFFISLGCGPDSNDDDPTPNPTPSPNPVEPTPPSPETPTTPDIDNPDQPARPTLDINDPVDQIARGAFHLCELADGRVYCWGDNTYNQLSVINRSDYTEVTAGLNHSCGLTEVGEVFCWGDNSKGQTNVPFASNSYVSISAGDNHTCGLNTMGGVTCWGDSDHGQNAIHYQILSNSISVGMVDSSGNRSCGLTINGDVLCWGAASDDQLDKAYTQFALGARHGCGLTTEGNIECWTEETNIHGQADNQSAPEDDSFKQLSLGAYHSCVLKNSGDVDCWGDNTHGQTNVPRDNFIQLTTKQNTTCGLTVDREVKCWGQKATIQLAVGYQHNCGIDSHGKLSCWGYNAQGQLDIPEEHHDSHFIQVVNGGNFSCGLVQENNSESSSGSGRAICWGALAEEVPVEHRSTQFSKLIASDYHICGFVAGTQHAVCWGSNIFKVVFRGKYDNATRIGDQQVYFDHLSRNGRDFYCGLRNNRHHVFCWRDNTYGQTDVPPGAQPPAEGEDPEDKRFSELDTGWYHTCGIRERDQKLFCWGRDNYGQGRVPADLADEAFLQVNLGPNNSCAILAGSGLAKCWGNDEDRQTTIPEGLRDEAFLAIDASDRHTCGQLARDRRIVCWGYGLSDNTKGYTDEFTQIDGGRSHGCALTAADNRLVCWGDSAINQTRLPEEYQDRSFTQLSAGDEHSCAILGGYLPDEGQLVCWGNISVGNQLAVPTDLETEKFDLVAVGRYRTCAVLRNARDFVYVTDAGRTRSVQEKTICWGQNPTGNAEVPLEYKPMDFKKIEVGYSHSCGFTEEIDRPFCWGRDANFQVKDAELYRDEQFQTLVVGMRTVCGIRKSDRTLACWGYDLFNDREQDIVPEEYQHLPFKKIALKYNHICGLLHDDALGADSDSLRECSEAQISELDPDAGECGVEILDGSCKENNCLGNLVCWGNTAWKKGIVPCDAQNEIFSDISLGVNMSCATYDEPIRVTASGERCVEPDEDEGETFSPYIREYGLKHTRCWGVHTRNTINIVRERMDQITGGLRFGCGLISDAQPELITIDPDIRIRDIERSNRADCLASLPDGADPDSEETSPCDCTSDPDTGEETCPEAELSTTNRTGPSGVDGDGKPSNLVCWGQIEPFPAGFTSGQKFSYVTSGEWHSCAIFAETEERAGQVICWGGVESRLDLGIRLPTAYQEYTFSQVSAGYDHTCGVRADEGYRGQVVCWGSNSHGQLIESYEDEELYNLRFQAVGAGDDFTCGLTTDQRIVCWGKGNGEILKTSNPN